MKRILPVFIIAIVAIALDSATAQVPDDVPSILTIDQAVSIGLKRNFTISRADVNIESSSARVNSAFGNFLPTIGLNGGYVRHLGDGSIVVDGTPIASSRPADSYQAGASASLLLFDGFSRTAEYNAAQAGYDASLASREAAVRDIAWQVRQTFLLALHAKQLLDVRQVEISTGRQQLERVIGRIELGVDVVSSQYAQEADLANAEVALLQAQGDYQVQLVRLNQLLNFDPTIPVNVSDVGIDLDLDSLELAANREALGTVEGMLEEVDRNRPDLAVQRHQIEAADARVDVARSAYYPTLSSGLGVGWNRSGLVSNIDGTFSINLQYNLFNGFRTEESVVVAKADRVVAEIELRRLTLQAHGDLTQALARLETAEKTLNATERNVRAARQNRFAADERYNVGVGNYTDYLYANSQYVSARINQVNAVISYWLAYYEVLYVLGRIDDDQ